MRQKFIAGTILALYVLFSFVWFSFGCEGLYRWFITSSSSSVSPTILSTPTSNEYVIRIIQETLPKEVLIDTVAKAVENKVLADNTDYAEGIAASLSDMEL